VIQVQIDHTVVDVMVVDERDRQPIVVCPAFSGRLICGISCRELLVQRFNADLVRGAVT
jgi:hypothetical protein